MADLSPSAVSVGVLSKTYALAGLRVGWLATRDRELLDAVSQVRDYTTLCSPAPSEVLGTIALRAAPELAERSRAIIAANLPLVDALMADHADRLDWVRPAAGSIGFPRYRGSEGIDAFNERLVAEQGVLLLPGRVYGYGDGRFRLGFGRRNAARGDREARPPAARVTQYDRIGTTYAARAIPTAASRALIAEALGDAQTVVNVGAGVGSYEPRDRDVTAVEPSAVMIAQRPADAAPSVQGPAERLPFADDAFDAALAVLTMHHWSDWRAGVAELRRVARRRAVMLTFDPDCIAQYWLVRDYLPEIAVLDEARFPPLAAVAEAMGGAEIVPLRSRRTARTASCARTGSGRTHTWTQACARTSRVSR